jgi:hypothetical protein
VTKFLSIICLTLVMAPPAPAQAPCPGKNVKVTLVVILASEQGNKVDKELRALAREVQIKNPNLKSFRIKSMAIKSLAADEKCIIPLVDNKTATIVIKHGADREKRISLAVTAPDQGEIVYRCVCDKFLPIVTRYQTRNDERLILAIGVQPCKED